MQTIENYGLETAHRRRPSIRVVVSKSNIYGSAHATMAVPPVIDSRNPRGTDLWNGEGPIGLAAMTIETPAQEQHELSDFLGNHVEIESRGKKFKKGLWAKIKKTFKRSKSPGAPQPQQPWRRRVVSGILVGKETKVDAEEKPMGLPKSKTTADFRPRRPISTNWKASYDEHFDLGDERDKKPEPSTAAERIGGMIRSASAIFPGRH